MNNAISLILGSPIWFAFEDGTMVNIRGLVSVDLDVDLTENSLSAMEDTDEIGEITVLVPDGIDRVDSKDYYITVKDYKNLQPVLRGMPYAQTSPNFSNLI